VPGVNFFILILLLGVKLCPWLWTWAPGVNFDSYLVHRNVHSFSHSQGFNTLYCLKKLRGEQTSPLGV
jgi:hypothetical protein